MMASLVVGGWSDCSGGRWEAEEEEESWLVVALTMCVGEVGGERLDEFLRMPGKWVEC